MYSHKHRGSSRIVSWGKELGSLGSCQDRGMEPGGIVQLVGAAGTGKGVTKVEKHLCF